MNTAEPATGTAITVLGGTFDPVHNGHLRLAQEIVNLVPEVEMRLLPCGRPAHKAEPVANADTRRKMLELALQGQDAIRVDDRELRRDGPSYSFHTLESLREEFPDRPLVLVLGDDAFCGLDTWYEWQKLTELANFLVIGRPGSHMPEDGPVAALWRRHRVDFMADLLSRTAGAMVYRELPRLDISSTAIRKQLAEGRSPRFLLPPAVLEYIEARGLYRDVNRGLYREPPNP